VPQQIVPIPWEQPGWQESAADWIEGQLDRLGTQPTGALEQPHLRPWSTVLRLPTTQGSLYFKAVSPLLGHEPALTQALAAWRPDCMPQVLAVESDRGWMLLADGGPTLRSRIQAGEGIEHWRRILPLYAALQQEMILRLPRLLELGALDRRLAGLPAQFESLLADTDALCIGLPDGLSEAEYQRLLDLRPRFAADCQELAGCGIPETLHHDDFHDGNIFAPLEGGYRFFDWAESCAAHPFFSLVVGLRGIAYRFEFAEDAAEIQALRELYLSCWQEYAPLQTLRRAAGLADRVGRVCRALTWYQAVARLPEPHRSEHITSVPGWLQEYLAAEFLV
jgi:hypothetical protein